LKMRGVLLAAGVGSRLLLATAEGRCHGRLADGCLALLAEHNLGGLGATRELVQACGDENPPLELLSDPGRLPLGHTRRLLFAGLPVAAGAVLELLGAAFAVLRGQAERLWELTVEHAHGCLAGPVCWTADVVGASLRRGHVQFLSDAARLTSWATLNGTLAPWIANIGDPAQIIARFAFDERHLDFVSSVITGLDRLGTAEAVGVLHDAAMRLASANCEMQAQLLAHFTLVSLPLPFLSGRPLPRFEFHPGACCRRYHVLAHLLSPLAVGPPQPCSTRMVEVGVNNALTSAYLLARFEGLCLEGVDPYIDAEAIFEEAYARLLRFGTRAKLHRATSEVASELFEPASLDLVFIDGDHSRDAVATDIAAWSSRVRPGGLLAGHDLFNPAFDGVLEALLEHVESRGEFGETPTIHFAPDYVWWLQL